MTSNNTHPVIVITFHTNRLADGSENESTTHDLGQTPRDDLERFTKKYVYYCYERSSMILFLLLYSFRITTTIAISCPSRGTSLNFKTGYVRRLAQRHRDDKT